MTRRFNREQNHFLTNVERARAAGVGTATAKAVETALLSGIDYCNFNGIAQPLTDEYLIDCQDHLFNKAVREGKQDDIRWVGQEQ